MHCGHLEKGANQTLTNLADWILVVAKLNFLANEVGRTPNHKTSANFSF